MSVQITYFVHGTTEDNEREISSGWSDVDLSKLGVRQSAELKDKINVKDFAIVFCSDLKRAVHSAERTFKKSVEIMQDARLRECNYGDYNGQLSSIVVPLQEQYIQKRFPNGESYEDVKNRISEFLNDVKQKYKNKHIAIVAHQAPQLALDVLLKGKTWGQAFREDWRVTKAWQPGWQYVLRAYPDSPFSAAIPSGRLRLRHSSSPYTARIRFVVVPPPALLRNAKRAGCLARPSGDFATKKAIGVGS